MFGITPIHTQEQQSSSTYKTKPQKKKIIFIPTFQKWIQNDQHKLFHTCVESNLWRGARTCKTYKHDTPTNSHTHTHTNFSRGWRIRQLHERVEQNNSSNHSECIHVTQRMDNGSYRDEENNNSITVNRIRQAKTEK